MPGLVPSIPVSPLILQCHSYATQLAQCSQKKDCIDSTQEQTQKCQHRIKLLTEQMQKVRHAPFQQWHPDFLAKQIVIINSQLFCYHGVQALDDFHTYLMHSVAHELIIANSYIAFDHAVRLAHCLHQYRDWNGCMAVVRALAQPSVQRLSTSSSSPLCHDFPWVPHHDDTTMTTSNDSSFTAYRQAFRRSLLALRPYRLDSHDRPRWTDMTAPPPPSLVHAGLSDNNDSGTDAVVAIPWLPPLKKVESAKDYQLLLALCRHNKWPESIECAKSLLLLPLSMAMETTSSATMAYSISSASLSARICHNLPPMISPSSVLDLSQLGQGDPSLYHWLVSRPFLTLNELMLESEQVESVEAMHSKPSVTLSEDMLPSEDISDNQDWRDQSLHFAHMEDDDDDMGTGKAQIVDNINDDDDDDDDMESDTSDAIQNVIASFSWRTPLLPPPNRAISQTISPRPPQVTFADGCRPTSSDRHPISASTTLPDSRHPSQLKPASPASKIMASIPLSVTGTNRDIPSTSTSAYVRSNRYSTITVDECPHSPTASSHHTLTQSIFLDAGDEESGDSSDAGHPCIQLDSSDESFCYSDSISSKSSLIANHRTLPDNADDSDHEHCLASPIIADDASEEWTGYPQSLPGNKQEERDDQDIWTGYPTPAEQAPSPQHTPSETSEEEEWKGYQEESCEALKTNAMVKLQDPEWHGYTLEALQ